MAGGGGMSAIGNFGRSQARRVDPDQIRITFDDVAGIDEAKAELTEIVDFLRTPERYQRLGGRMPHGVLLYGQPGTGKTLLARAVAGEAHAAFFSIAASEFIEAIVGVGAARVRDLFAKAKEAAPAIIFIDELDAVGRTRAGSAGGVTGANDEREQTLDQILTEMDGFEPEHRRRRARGDQPSGDPRPGAVAPWSLRPPGRGATARQGRAAADPPGPHARPAARPGRRPRGARRLDPGNGRRRPREPRQRGGAARRAARPRPRRDGGLHRSLEKIMLGAPRGIMLTKQDRERTAYHESGHALVGMLTPGADPVRKVSIIPRGMALGVTLSTPDVDRVGYSREDLEAKIRVALGGRVAEEVVYGQITTGAESDIQQLTADRPRDGRAVGHERQARSDRAVTVGGLRRVPAARRLGDIAADAVAGRRGGAPARRAGARRGDATPDRAPRPARVTRPRAARRGNARRTRGLRRRARAGAGALRTGRGGFLGVQQPLEPGRDGVAHGTTRPQGMGPRNDDDLTGAGRRRHPERISLALDDEHRDPDAAQLAEPRLRGISRLPGRMQRERQAQHTRRAGRRRRPAGDTSA